MINKDFYDLIGLTFKEISYNKYNNSLALITDTDRCFRLVHFRRCVEEVSLFKIIGNLDSIINTPITYAREIASTLEYTLQRINTDRGSVILHWISDNDGGHGCKIKIIED